MSPRPPPHLIKGSLASGEGVLLLGLFRSGTKSIYHAMHILGYEHVHHASEDHDDDSWDRIAEAAHATFPILSRVEDKPKPREFARADWDRVFGEYQAVSDAASIFAPELIAAYPGAKVVLVQRDFESWLASVDTVFISSVLDPRRKLLYDLVVRPVRKLHFYVGLRSICMGLFGATTAEGARRRAREIWEAHHETVRRMVPKERLLDFRPGEELCWERLCAFLGKEVPVGVDFPKELRTAVRRSTSHHTCIRIPLYNLVVIQTGFSKSRQRSLARKASKVEDVHQANREEKYEGRC